LNVIICSLGARVGTTCKALAGVMPAALRSVPARFRSTSAPDAGTATTETTTKPRGSRRRARKIGACAGARQPTTKSHAATIRDDARRRLTQKASQIVFTAGKNSTNGTATGGPGMQTSTRTHSHSVKQSWRASSRPTDEAKAREVWRWWEAQAANHTVAHPSRGGKRAVEPC
jgi:hypothetical protein